MSAQALTRTDRLAGYAMLALGVACLFAPTVEFGQQRLNLFLASLPFMGAAYALLSNQAAARTSAQWARRAAALFFALGLAAPFLANLIDAYVGA